MKILSGNVTVSAMAVQMSCSSAVPGSSAIGDDSSSFSWTLQIKYNKQVNEDISTPITEEPILGDKAGKSAVVSK